MTEFVDNTVSDIDARLSELEEELSRLQAARAALLGERRGPGRPRRARSTSTGRRGTRKPGRPRGRRGGNTRANQALELVRLQPGITIPQIAEALGIGPNYLYRVMPRLVDDGQVKREGEGWQPVSESKNS